MLIKNTADYIKKVKGAIHVGGHDGGERDWYKSLGFSPVIWFEPNIELFKRLKENIKGYENHKAYNFAVHDTLKTGVLNISSNDGQSSSILELGLHKQYHPKVHYVGIQSIELIRLDSFFEGNDFVTINDFNLLNIDVQGVELNVIKSLGELIKHFDYIYCEINIAELYKGCSLVEGIDTYLKEFGFNREVTYMTKNKWGDALYIKR